MHAIILARAKTVIWKGKNPVTGKEGNHMASATS